MSSFVRIILLSNAGASAKERFESLGDLVTAGVLDWGLLCVGGGVLEDKVVDAGDRGELGGVVEVRFPSYSAPSAASIEAGVGSMTTRYVALVDEAVYVTIVEQ